MPNGLLLARTTVNRLLKQADLMDRPDGVESCYMPKHRSWVNIAQNELGCMMHQCIYHRRFGDLEMLQREIQAWSSDVNERQLGVDRHMTVDARRKLKPVYPRILL